MIKEDEAFILKEELIQLSILSKTRTLVFPKDGLGTGLAKMPEKSPNLFKFLCRILKESFDINLTKDGFI